MTTCGDAGPIINEGCTSSKKGYIAKVAVRPAASEGLLTHVQILACQKTKPADQFDGSLS